MTLFKQDNQFWGKTLNNERVCVKIINSCTLADTDLRMLGIQTLNLALDLLRRLCIRPDFSSPDYSARKICRELQKCL